MWCESGNADLKGKLRDYIIYFEGTCEFCLNNMGLQQYLADIEDNLEKFLIYDDETIMLLYYDYGVINYKLDKLDKAKDAWENALNYVLKIKDRVFEAKIKSYLSIYYYEKGELETSKKFFGEAAATFEAFRRYDEMALHYVNILWYKRYEEDKTEVLEYMEKAFKYVQMADSARNGRVYLHLGYIYKTIFNDFLGGLQYLRVASEICRRTGNVEMETMTLHVLADGFLQLSRYNEALEIYETLKEPKYRNVTANLKCMLLANVTGCYLRLGRIDEALEQIDMMREHIDEAQTNIREEFECVHEWLLAINLMLSGGDLRDVKALLTESENIYEKDRKGFPIEYFDYHLADAWSNYYQLAGDNEKALDYAVKRYNYSKVVSKAAEKASCEKLAELYETMGDSKESQKYKKLAGKIADEIEGLDIIPQYSKVFESFRKDREKVFGKSGKQKKTSGKYNDTLTGFFNDEYLNEIRKKKKGFFASGRDGIICADMDHSGAYKKTYGEEELETCIAKLADIIKTGLEPIENRTSIFRIAGDEFVILIKDTDEQELGGLAEKVVLDVRRAQIHNTSSDVSPFVTVSVGYCLGEPKERTDRILDRASMALHDAKEAGRGKAVQWK